MINIFLENYSFQMFSITLHILLESVTKPEHDMLEQISCDIFSPLNYALFKVVQCSWFCSVYIAF
jgi:hypothetical protein